MRQMFIERYGLSNREAEVAELVSNGLSNKEVANQLFVTEKTAKFHLTNIYRKMKVRSRAQLIVASIAFKPPAPPQVEETQIEAEPAQELPVGENQAAA